ncbi:flagellar protein FlaG [Candidatus Magnetobacterium casense]|uniref:Flagellar protein FlaG n=1 Tax=Candidatus Magnetobacterium casense TaxID=1455061 RepID=A0ABS6RZB9_9BACT|nr:flagellar protein FlaG [Candidatus Magnetobacterium casensis]MBV6341997.1 hypothetical protein [Candidatus Magnetobacterium casensis]
MEIKGVSINVQTTARSAESQANKRAYAQPSSQPHYRKDDGKTAKTQDSVEGSVRVTITKEGKDRLNSSRQNSKEGRRGAARVEKQAAGIVVQSEKEASEKNKDSAKTPGSTAVVTTRAYYAIEKDSKDDKETVVVKIVDENGRVIREIPPEDFFKGASELNAIPNELYHALA